ncbi:MAG: type IX secretion system sortase PorU [Bacteroidota bacterium]
MRRYTFLLFIIIVGFSVSDVQKEFIKLNWTDHPDGHHTEHQGVSSFLYHTKFLETNSELPYYVRLYDRDKSGKNYQFIIENPVFEEIDTPKDGLSLGQIKNEIQVQTKLLKSGDIQKVELQIIPLKQDNGKLFRLKSFLLKRIPVVIQKSSSKQYEWKNESVLKSGKWIKISTNGKGIYKIPYSKLTEWGFPNPAQVNVFGSGGTVLPENPGDILYDDLNQNAVWRNKNNGEDCLFFYALGVTKWDYKKDNDLFEHKTNDYATKGYFFLSENVGSQKNVELLPEISAPATHTVTSFNEFALVENDLVNILPLGSGKRWFGEKFGNGTSRNFSFTVSDVDILIDAKINISVAGRSYQTSSMTVSTQNGTLGDIQFSKINTSSQYDKYADDNNEIFTQKISDGPLQVKLKYEALNSSAEAWNDYIELNYRRKLKAGNNAVFFRDIGSVGDGNIAEFNIENGSSAFKLLDVTNLNNVKEIPIHFSDNKIRVKRPAHELREYVIFNPEGNFPEPVFVEEVQNQNLHSLSTPELLIITHPQFITFAEQLAAFHRNYDGMSVELVDVNNIYNEYSSGIKSAVGIRDFIKMFYDRDNTLKYVLLFGDGSYDNKNIRPDSKNFIPTFQSNESLVPTRSFVSDDYYAILDDDESIYNGTIDLGIGRIPSSTTYEAELVVDKILRYYKSEALGDWRNTLCFIGDDGDGGLHMRQSEQLADIVNKDNKEFITDKIYFDAFTEEVTSAGERYPGVNAAINERVKDGVLVLNYVGHANDRFLAHEHVLDVSDINSWSNTNKLPIFVTATCEFSRFDADETSAGEYVLLNPNGGGIGLFSTTRVVYAESNFRLSKNFYNHIFTKNENGEHYRMGDVMRLAKLNTSGNINKRNFSLLADPALKLSYPKYQIITNSVNHQDATGMPDTIGALQKITISGYVADYFDNQLNNFNGEIIPTVYDKEVLMETLGNGGTNPVEFKVRENIIYKGRASVTNGNFTFSFVIPKDISYSVGEGKIVYYANNGTDDAHGAFENFLIGGSGSEISDNKGPDIQLFMDSPEFVSGDKTSKNPTLLAYLSDENGINTVGTGIGHDITAVLDNDYSNVVVLNQYYQADMDDYTSGVVQYPFKNLSVGWHTLKLKAWDVANNSSEVEIEFEVSGDFSIGAISNYPNPVSQYTYFVFEHNQSDATLKAIFDIFDQNGRRVDQFQSEVGSSGTKSNPVRWDLTESQIAITPGVYIYRVIVQNSDGVIASESGKMIVAR